MNKPFNFKLACLVLAIQAGFPTLASAVTYEQRILVPKLSVTGSSSTSTGATNSSGGLLSGGSANTGESTSTSTNSGGTTGNGTDVPPPAQAPVATLSTSALNFGALPGGQTGTAAVVLTNTGTASLTLLSAPAISGDSAFSSQTNCLSSLAPSASCSTTVFFQATDAADHRGLLLFSTNASATPSEVSLSGSSLLAQGVLSPATSGDFSNVSVGQSGTRTFTFSNPGNTTATGVMANLNGPSDLSFTTNTCGTSASAVSVAAGGSCSMTVNWAPSTYGTLAASLSVSGSFSGSPSSIALSGSATGAVATLSTANLAFGDVNMGTTAAKAVQLTNTGNDTLTFAAPPALTGDTAYSAQTNCGTSLPAGQACTTNVTFAPLTAGPLTASMRFQSNAYAGADQTVSMTGTGKSLLSTLNLSSTTLAFGPVLKGTSASATLTLSNTGTVSTPLTIGAVAAPFSKTGTTCNTALAAGASCTITLSYAPTTDADYSSGNSLPLTWGDAHETTSVALSGTVIDSALSVTALSFADTAVGVTSAAQSVTLSNPGSATLTVGTPTTAAPYATSYTCGANLAPGQNCLVSVTFTPTQANSQPSVLTIPTGAGDKAVTLSGKGLTTMGELAVTPSGTLAFGTVAAGSAGAQTVTLKNTGAVTRNLTVGTPAAPYGLTTTCGTSLAPNATCNVIVSFSPTDYQSYTTGYSLPLTWGPLNETASIALTGTGSSALSTLGLSPATVAFGTVAQNSTGTQVLTLTNTGTQAQALSLGAVSAPFAIAATSCGTTLAASSSCTVTLTFTPTTQGSYAGYTLPVTWGPKAEVSNVPLTGAGADPYSANVTMMMHMDGGLTDNMGHTVTNNSAAISTTYKKFGTGSAYAPSMGNRFSIPSGTGVSGSSTTNFTLEFWLYTTAYPSTYGVIFASQTSGGFASTITSTGALSFGRSLIATEYTTPNTLSKNAWHHVAYVRNGSTITIYADGAILGSATSTTTYPSGATNFFVDGNSSSFPIQNLYIDDLRITPGVARYTGSTYTVPTNAFPE